jgi:hypothetical protein
MLKLLLGEIRYKQTHALTNTYSLCVGFERRIVFYLQYMKVVLVHSPNYSTGLIFVNNQLDHNSFSRMFISILYMFRAATCPSSGELIVLIRHLVYVTLYR